MRVCWILTLLAACRPAPPRRGEEAPPAPGVRETCAACHLAMNPDHAAPAEVCLGCHADGLLTTRLTEAGTACRDAGEGCRAILEAGRDPLMRARGCAACHRGGGAQGDDCFETMKRFGRRER